MPLHVVSTPGADAKEYHIKDTQPNTYKQDSDLELGSGTYTVAALVRSSPCPGVRSHVQQSCEILSVSRRRVHVCNALLTQLTTNGSVRLFDMRRG